MRFLYVGYEIDGEVTTDFLLPTSWKGKARTEKAPRDGSAISAASANSMNCRRTAESMWNSLRSRSDSLSPWSATVPGREDIIYRESPLKK